MGRLADDSDAKYFAAEFAQVQEMLHGLTVEEFMRLPLIERKAIFSQHLVQQERVFIREGEDDNHMNIKIANGFMLFQRLFMSEDEKSSQMVKEAREVHYGENEFWVELHWLCEFQDDQYDGGLSIG